ncbi:hypothetical protein RFY44_06035 [Acinetobacter bereziniae]|nr:hypothetical protein [Acinetobacter bereziniae]MDQ9818440.1 hypothetical protein [Acinetobacter bereziniae]
MSQTSSKKFPKIYLLAALGLLFPVFLVGMAFLAAKSDAETQREYDRIRQEHAERIELQKQQQKSQQDTTQTNQNSAATSELDHSKKS